MSSLVEFSAYVDDNTKNLRALTLDLTQILAIREDKSLIDPHQSFVETTVETTRIIVRTGHSWRVKAAYKDVLDLWTEALGCKSEDEE